MKFQVPVSVPIGFFVEVEAGQEDFAPYEARQKILDTLRSIFGREPVDTKVDVFLEDAQINYAGIIELD